MKARWGMKMNKRQRVRIRTEPRAQNSDSFILQVIAERDIYLQSAAARAPHPVLPASRRKSDVHAQKHLSLLPLQKKKESKLSLIKNGARHAYQRRAVCVRGR